MKRYYIAILLILLFLQSCIKETVSTKDLEKNAYIEKLFSKSNIDKFNKKIEEIKSELKSKTIEHCYIQITNKETLQLDVFGSSSMFSSIGWGYTNKYGEFLSPDEDMDRLTYHFIKSGDLILGTDICFLKNIRDNCMTTEYSKYNFIPKYCYILLKYPSELIGIVNKVHIVREGKRMTIDIKKWVKSNPPPDPKHDMFSDYKIYYGHHFPEIENSKIPGLLP